MKLGFARVAQSKVETAEELLRRVREERAGERRWTKENALRRQRFAKNAQRAESFASEGLSAATIDPRENEERGADAFALPQKIDPSPPPSTTDAATTSTVGAHFVLRHGARARALCAVQLRMQRPATGATSTASTSGSPIRVRADPSSKLALPQEEDVSQQPQSLPPPQPSISQTTVCGSVVPTVDRMRESLAEFLCLEARAVNDGGGDCVVADDIKRQSVVSCCAGKKVVPSQEAKNSAECTASSGAVPLKSALNEFSPHWRHPFVPRLPKRRGVSRPSSDIASNNLPLSRVGDALGIVIPGKGFADLDDCAAGGSITSAQHLVNPPQNVRKTVRFDVPFFSGKECVTFKVRDVSNGAGSFTNSPMSRCKFGQQVGHPIALQSNSHLDCQGDELQKANAPCSAPAATRRMDMASPEDAFHTGLSLEEKALTDAIRKLDVSKAQHCEELPQELRASGTFHTGLSLEEKALTNAIRRLDAVMSNCSAIRQADERVKHKSHEFCE